MITKTTPALKCTCPRGIYSHNCPITSHRNIAHEINCLFINSGTGRHRRPRGVGKGSYRRRDWKACVEFWMANAWDSGKIKRWILVFIVGFLLMAIGAQLYHRMTDSQSLTQIIQSQIAGGSK